MNNSTLTYRIAKRLKNDLALSWGGHRPAPPFASPADFATAVSYGQWKAAKHHAMLNAEIMRALGDAELGLIDGLIVSMPPQHGKSELCSRYLPAWYLGTYPNRRVILTSYEAGFAATWGGKARDLLEEHGSRFGVRVSHRSSATDRWDIEGHDGGMNTAGAGGPITGKGAHLFIIDDPIKNDEEARSPTIRNKQWGWYLSTATTRLRPGALTVVIQTRWHRDDLTGRILENAKNTGQRWRSIVFPAMAEENDPLGRAPGEVLWPEVYTQEIMERKKASLTAYYWQSIYQQNPQAEGGAEWPESLFGPEIWFDEWPQDAYCKVISLDPSKGKDAKHGDFSAFVMLLLGHDGVVYVDADLAIRDTSIIAEQALELNATFRPDWFPIETNQFQQLLSADIIRIARSRGQLIPVVEVNNQVNKNVRIRRITPYLSQREIRFKANSPSARLLVQQLKDFPNGDHDDGPDALEMAIRVASEQLGKRNNYDPLAGMSRLPGIGA